MIKKGLEKLTTQTWTPKKIAKLRELWDKGLSTSEIGKKLGVTKNSVVGKAHRLELDARMSPIKTQSDKKEKVEKKSKKPELKVVEKITPKKAEPKIKVVEEIEEEDFEIEELSSKKGKKDDHKGVNITQLKLGMCRWPIGDPKSKDFHFCGRPTFKSKPYCLEHTVVAYIPKNTKEKKDGKNSA